MVVTVHPIATFFATTGVGLGLTKSSSCPYRSCLILLPSETSSELLPLVYFHFGSFVVGLSCAFTNGKVILESAILTSVVVISLTLYTLWAAEKGYDFNFLGPFLFGALIVLIGFAIIQTLFPLKRISLMIYGCLASVIFCGYIVYDTHNLIKQYTYDEYIWTAVSLYLDIINLFLSLLTIFRVLQR